ncbi:XRE family transcriptional regulator (plasmid) [Deinococcus psychrotolerans]|uniref:XRE family transcriptional regulator n=1 Tax=Deinococcus psychrotolerans TaxID=2489213 RepID=A0A3G8YVY8_9DEIO|nr:helix-turn-helix domain-containing protein [Deinococcus psychrotolerans]AZI45336.1 XRE family transcriptional regulator [Deinococcus psychrotolerans]
MTDRAQLRAARLAALMNEDGTLTPADHLPVGLMAQESAQGIEEDFQQAIIANSLAQAWKIARQRESITGKALAERRKFSTARLSQIENDSHNPTLSSVADHADALGYDVQVILTQRINRQKIAVPVPSHTLFAAD